MDMESPPSPQRFYDAKQDQNVFADEAYLEEISNSDDVHASFVALSIPALPPAPLLPMIQQPRQATMQTHEVTTPHLPPEELPTPPDALMPVKLEVTAMDDDAVDSNSQLMERNTSPIGDFEEDDYHTAWGTALYKFAAREEGELAFETGDRILVIDRSDPVWW
jgi:hypothetical protein